MRKRQAEEADQGGVNTEDSNSSRPDAGKGSDNGSKSILGKVYDSVVNFFINFVVGAVAQFIFG